MLEGIEVKDDIPRSVIEELRKKVEQLKALGLSEEDVKKFAVNFLEKRGFKAKIVAKSVKISNIGRDVEVKKMVTIKGKVLTLFEPKSDKILQTGLMADETGVIRFVLWNGEKVPECVKPGQTYVFKNVVVNEFAEAYQVESTQDTEIEKCKESVQMCESRELTGVVLAIAGGLNVRCSECYRSISESCPIHGNVGEVYTLDVKMLLSTTDDDIWVVIPERVFKELTGFDVDIAIEKAKKSMDKSAIVKEVEKYLVGRVITVKGPYVEWGKYKALHAESTDIPDVRQLVVEKLKEVV